MRLIYIGSERIVEVAGERGYARPETFGQRDRCAEDTMVEGVTQTEVYYQLCSDSLRPPHQHEFVTCYETGNEAWFASSGPRLASGMRFRVARAWPSFVAEHHLFSLAIEHGAFDAAYKDIQTDVSGGSDMALHSKHGNLYVASFTDTKDGWAKAKRKRKQRIAEAPCVYLPLNFTGDPRPVKCRGFHLYSVAHIDGLLSAWDEMLSEGMDYATWHCGRLYRGLTDPHATLIGTADPSSDEHEAYMRSLVASAPY
jgi:hypothetical protein